MKKIIVLAILAAMCLTSCQKDEKTTDHHDMSIDATSGATWHYYSFAKNAVIGSGEENETDNAAWAKRSDWDIAVCRYKIRTNSGTSTTTNAMGGVFTCKADVIFDALASVPSGAAFRVDYPVTTTGMGGTTTSISQSDATVILFQTNEDGSLVMPPVYLTAPVYIFRTADGKCFYKVQFTQYLNENSESGHVKFISQEIK